MPKKHEECVKKLKKKGKKESQAWAICQSTIRLKKKKGKKK